MLLVDNYTQKHAEGLSLWKLIVSGSMERLNAILMTASTSALGLVPLVVTEENSHYATPSKGGQVVESGAYHLEFVPEKESGGVHLDFYLQKGDRHENIPNAKITAQIQLPNGTSKTLDFTYKDNEKHYTALFPKTLAGQYQVKIMADMNGEKVEGRFSFSN